MKATGETTFSRRAEKIEKIYLVVDTIAQMTMFNYSDDMHDIYLNGDCCNLANELSKLLQDSELYCIYGSSKRGKDLVCIREPIHYCVKYKNKYIDIRGVFTKEEMLQYWTEVMSDCSPCNTTYKYYLLPEQIPKEPDCICSRDIDTANKIYSTLQST